MSCLSSAVALGDVDDVDAFVCAAVRKLGLTVSGHEREELEAEGFLVMCELDRKYTPAHAGSGWSFSSYAGEYLPRRLIDAWHRLHRGEHVRRPSSDGGGRRWEYRSIASLDVELVRPSFSEVGLRRVGEFARIAAYEANVPEENRQRLLSREEIAS